MDEEALDRLYLLEPEPDPEPCRCKRQWLISAPSAEPDLYEMWYCGRCGNRVIRAIVRQDSGYDRSML